MNRTNLANVDIEIPATSRHEAIQLRELRTGDTYISYKIMKILHTTGRLLPSHVRTRTADLFRSLTFHGTSVMSSPSEKVFPVTVTVREEENV